MDDTISLPNNTVITEWVTSVYHSKLIPSYRGDFVIELDACASNDTNLYLSVGGTVWICGETIPVIHASTDVLVIPKTVPSERIKVTVMLRQKETGEMLFKMSDTLIYTGNDDVYDVGESEASQLTGCSGSTRTGLLSVVYPIHLEGAPGMPKNDESDDDCITLFPMSVRHSLVVELPRQIDSGIMAPKKRIRSED